MSGSWRKYTFFEKDVISENLSEDLGSNVTTLIAEGGMLLLGDENGRITMTGRDFQGQPSSILVGSNSTSSIEKKDPKQVFKGPVHSLSYLFDSKNQSRQYVVAIGEDNPNFIPKQNITSSTEEKVDMMTSHSSASSSSSMASSQSINYTTIKVFNATDLSRPLQSFSAGFPGLSVTAKVTASSVLSDGTEIIVGYSNGAIVLFVGAFLKDATPNTRVLPAQVLLSDHNHPVTALYFCEVRLLKTSNENQIRLFAVFDTESMTASDPMNAFASASSDIGGITVFDVSTTLSPTGTPILLSSRQSPHILDDRGATRFCSCYVKDMKELVVGRIEGIFSYSVEDRGGAAGFEGEKQCVSAVGRYILVANLDEKTRRSNITIYDLRNKFISFSGQIASGERVAAVTHDGGMAYILTSSQLLLRYRERDTASKVEVLLKKSLYSLAISLATEEQSDVAEIMKLYKQYGDHLYKKGDYDAAMIQFISTIGYLQSSYVIRRYLEPHRMYNLTTYLEKILERGLANKEHKTLLLTCYTKLKDEEKIKSFLNLHNASGLVSSSSSSSASSGISSVPSNRISTNSPFTSVAAVVSVANMSSDTELDSESCVDVLINAGYIEYGLQLAASYGHHHLYLELQITKCGESGSEAALVYISSLALILSSEAFLALLEEHLPVLLESKPLATTGLMIKLCRGDIISLKSSLQDIPSAVSTHIASIRNDSTNTVHSMNRMVNRNPMQSNNIISIAIEDLMDQYVDQEEYLKILIEGVYAVDDNVSGKVIGFHNRILPIKVTNTLLELYLEEYNKLKAIATKDKTKEIDAKTMETKIMSILDGHPNEYDMDRALLLMHNFHFDIGTRYLLEKTMATPLLLRLCVESNDDKGIMKILRKEGLKDSDLFVQVLTYFVKRSMSVVSGKEKEKEADSEDNDRWDSIEEVMAMIEKDAILSPAQVISILSLNPELPFSVASKYIFKVMQEVKDDTVVFQYNVDMIKSSISSILTEEAARKQLGGVVVSDPNSKRSQNQSNKKRQGGSSSSGSRGGTARANPVTGQLEDDDEEEEDDIELHRRERAAEQKKWESILKAMVDRSTDHESFYAELEHSVDGFYTMAGYFGKTIVYDSNLMS